jgi:ech hydrogenase subunit D
MDEQTIRIISPSDLLSETLQLKNSGDRLVAITCTNKNGLELSYSFDKNYELINIRFTIEIGSDVEIESISCFYPYAFLYENEIKELFGVKIKNIALDYNNNLYKISVKTPFNQPVDDNKVLTLKKENE